MAAPAAGKGKRKRPLSEDDVYLLLHRYAPGTILTALQEVAQHANGRRIDWKAVVRKSATGITSAREYQMLWRHFAYHHELDDAVDAGEQPLALISGSSREQASGQRVNLDAPVLNCPNEKIARVPSEKQLAQSHRMSNITGPVSNSKQASHSGPSPGSLDPNGPSKKKKKPKAWSKEEDADLAAGVQKYGERNWDDILHKCNFDNTRTLDQLSQRWALICKRPGGSTKPASTKQHVTVASSEERKDALKALTMAVGPIPRTSSLRSVLTTHATEQVHSDSEVAVVNPPGPSTHTLETKKASSTTPVPVSCDSEEKEDESTFCVITIDDLFPEDAKQPETVDQMAKQPEVADQKAKQPETVDPKAKQPETADPKAKQTETADPKAKQPETADAKAKQPDTLNPKVEIVDPKDKDMLEFDQFVASQGGLNTDHLDKSKTGRSALQGQGLVGIQKKQVKLEPTVGKVNPVSAGTPAMGKRTKTPVPHIVNPVPAGTPRGIVGTVNANAPNKTLVRKAATPVPAGAQAPPMKKHAANTKGNQVMQPSIAAVGSGVTTSSQANVAVNGTNKANLPSSSGQASAAVNIGSKVKPPSSGQASAVVNIGGKAKPPSSGQASVAVNGANRVANPPSSSQAGAAVSGAANKANPPAAPKQ
ncbi:hypothetical protein BAE44_0011204 [Dichanthelium oligosanthes]|uniref:Uncharacterized protein n=1 Tax=Dichanthelium oligosanthes TaxID=888268 RepID=A0A1E5VRN4_9POAL|nr:hypothetical protein BAE44_0011204 [Dichanthelium oligosanthes]